MEINIDDVLIMKDNNSTAQGNTITILEKLSNGEYKVEWDSGTITSYMPSTIYNHFRMHTSAIGSSNPNTVFKRHKRSKS